MADRDPASEWIYQPCSAEGCTVMIRSKIGHQLTSPPVCRWCLERFEQERNLNGLRIVK